MNIEYPENIVYLSRRNLLTLLHKLDRQTAGEQTHCTIVKYQGTSTTYQQSMDAITIVAVDDGPYYTSQGRHAGEVQPLEENFLSHTYSSGV